MNSVQPNKSPRDRREALLAENRASSCTSGLPCSAPDGAIHIGWFCPGSKRFCYTDEKQAWPVSRQAFTVPVYAIPQAPNDGGDAHGNR